MVSSLFLWVFLWINHFLLNLVLCWTVSFSYWCRQRVTFSAPRKNKHHTMISSSRKQSAVTVGGAAAVVVLSLADCVVPSREWGTGSADQEGSYFVWLCSCRSLFGDGLVHICLIMRNGLIFCEFHRESGTIYIINFGFTMRLSYLIKASNYLVSRRKSAFVNDIGNSRFCKWLFV